MNSASFFFRCLALLASLALSLPIAHADPKKVYAWHPERAKSGPILIVVDLDVQVAYVYRNGVEIGRTNVSTGRAGHTTPTGVFSILGKDVNHHSNVYDNAPMPFAERLTWSGVFLHAGGLPGYPSSHGCVHLPLAFAKDLYRITAANDTTVVITSKAQPPAVSALPLERLLGLENTPPPDGAADGKVFWKPELSKKGAIAVVISSADKVVEVFRAGVLIGSGPVTLPPGLPSLSEAVYLKLANGKWGTPAQWVTVDVGSGIAPTLVQLRASGVTIAPAIASQLKHVLKPGALVITTAAPLSAAKRSATGFIGVEANSGTAAPQ